MNNEKMTYSAKEVASLLGCSLRFVYQLCTEKTLPHIRLGRKLIFPKSTFNEWLEKKNQIDRL